MGEIIALRLVHILAAMFWFGSGLFSTFFLTPALREIGPGAGQVMGALRRRGLFQALPIVATLTILSGFRLMWVTSGGFAPAYFQTTRGMVFGAAGGCALVAFALSLLIVRPANVRLAALRQNAGEGSPQRVRRLGMLASVGGTAALVLLSASAVGMSIARYLG